MKRMPLDIYEEMPRGMRAYLNNYGWHFNKRACEMAVKQMVRKNATTDKEEAIEPWSKDQVEEMLNKYGVKLKNCVLYDHVYVANMGKADYLKSSITDEAHLALYVKDTIDDVDGSDELPFRSWVQKMVAMGIPVEWEDMR